MNELTKSLTNTQKQNILKLLQGATVDVAQVLGLHPDLVRSSLFERTEKERSSIISASTFNVNREEELTISLPVGCGTTGRCFEAGQPNIAIFSADWSEDHIEEP